MFQRIYFISQTYFLAKYYLLFEFILCTSGYLDLYYNVKMINARNRTWHVNHKNNFCKNSTMYVPIFFPFKPLLSSLISVLAFSHWITMQMGCIGNVFVGKLLGRRKQMIYSSSEIRSLLCKTPCVSPKAFLIIVSRFHELFTR